MRWRGNEVYGKGEAKEDVAEAKQSPEVRRIATAKQREAWQRHYTALDCITWGGRGKARKSLAKARHGTAEQRHGTAMERLASNSRGKECKAMRDVAE